MRATGAVIDRLGARTTAVTVAALGIAAVLPGLASSPAQLALALLVIGAASGAMDVAINAEGVLEEETSGQPVLNLAHASFSPTVVAASLLAAAPGVPAGLAGIVATVSLPQRRSQLSLSGVE